MSVNEVRDGREQNSDVRELTPKETTLVTGGFYCGFAGAVANAIASQRNFYPAEVDTGRRVNK